jgi:hypothetical protein
MPLLIAYVLVCALSLAGALAANGGGAEIAGRVLSALLSLPWCLLADHLKFQEGTRPALAIAAAGMMANSLLLGVNVLAKRRRRR